MFLFANDYFIVKTILKSPLETIILAITLQGNITGKRNSTLELE